jgi:hypothetical protein
VEAAAGRSGASTMLLDVAFADPAAELMVMLTLMLKSRMDSARS